MYVDFNRGSGPVYLTETEDISTCFFQNMGSHIPPIVSFNRVKKVKKEKKNRGNCDVIFPMLSSC